MKNHYYATEWCRNYQCEILHAFWFCKNGHSFLVLHRIFTSTSIFIRIVRPCIWQPSAVPEIAVSVFVLWLFTASINHSTNSRISPGWQFSALQTASSVLNRMALAFPVLSMERLASVKSTFSESSFNDIFRLAIMTSKFTMIGMA